MDTNIQPSSLFANNLSVRALIMKGGGIKGLAYIGALEQLKDVYNFNWFIGTSAGAITAILLGAGYTTGELRVILQNKNFKDFFDATWYQKPINLLRHHGLYHADAFTDWIDKLLAEKLHSHARVKMSDLPHRATVFASRRGTSVLKFDSQDSDADAAYAARCSMSIPWVFTPQLHQGIRTYDGGIKYNYPVDELLREYPGTPFISLYLGTEIYEPVRSKSVLADIVSIAMESSDPEVISKYRDSTVIIDPRPIRTLDFALSNDEKELLLQAGRVGALSHLSPEGPEFNKAQASLHKLRAKVEAGRDLIKRRRKKIRISTGIAACMMFAILWFTISWFSQISSADVRSQVDKICQSLATTQNTDGGFKGVGNVKGMDERSEEWTTAKTIFILASWKHRDYREEIKRAVKWLIDDGRRRDGGWTSVAVSLPDGTKPITSVPTAWSVMALIKAENLLDSSITSETHIKALQGIEWLLDNQNDDGGWGGFKKGASSGSRTYPTSIVILVLLDAIDVGFYNMPERIVQSLNDALLYLYNSKKGHGWSHSPQTSEVQLPSTAIALTALLMAEEAGYSVAVTPSLEEICKQWQSDLKKGKFQYSSAIDIVHYTNPDLGQVQVEYIWYPWTMIASDLMDFEYGTKRAYSYIKGDIVPNRDNLFPWQQGKSAFAMLVYLDRHDNEKWVN